MRRGRPPQRRAGSAQGEKRGRCSACVHLLDEIFAGHGHELGLEPIEQRSYELGRAADVPAPDVLGAPLATGLQLNDGLDHRERRWIRGRISAPDLAEHRRDLRKAPEHFVLPLQLLARLLDGDVREGKGRFHASKPSSAGRSRLDRDRGGVKERYGATPQSTLSDPYERHPRLSERVRLRPAARRRQPRSNTRSSPSGRPPSASPSRDT
jgi:hypothetical protein